MWKIIYLVLSFLVIASSTRAAAENQTWKVRPGDTLDIIASTLDIPKEEIKKTNPGVLDNSLQIDQKLKLPLRSHGESVTLEEELAKKGARIGELESRALDLEMKIAGVESQLLWYPVWFWGFWICFGIIAFIVSGAIWIFRQTHPQIFEQPHERSIRELRESQIQLRSSFPRGEEAISRRVGQWQPLPKRPLARRDLRLIQKPVKLENAQSVEQIARLPENAAVHPTTH